MELVSELDRLNHRVFEGSWKVDVFVLETRAVNVIDESSADNQSLEACRRILSRLRGSLGDSRSCEDSNELIVFEDSSTKLHKLSIPVVFIVALSVSEQPATKVCRI